MEKVMHIKSYLFSDGKHDLALKYGRVTFDDQILPEEIYQRWAFNGLHIPFPIRSGTWFEGFSSGVMIDYLKSAGYSYKGCVNILTGHMYVNTAYEPSQKGNENIPSQKGNG